MRLPNANRAFVDLAKLRDYCLNPSHPRGQHKASVFFAVLGLTASDAVGLQAALLDAARRLDAIIGARDQYGQRYTIDVLMVGPTGQGTVRSAWIVRADEDYPRLTTCYVV